MSALHDLAALLGIVWKYWDGAGRHQEAPDETLRMVCEAMGHPARTERDAAASLATEEARRNARLLPEFDVVEAERPAQIPLPGGAPVKWRLELEDGQVFEGTASWLIDLPALPVGYHFLETQNDRMALLSAPARLPEPVRHWGVMVPLYGLKPVGQDGIGSYADLAETASALGSVGAGFVGLNPVHAGFPLDDTAYSPYSPSSRQWLNTTHVAVEPGPKEGAAPGGAAGSKDPDAALIDYLSAIPAIRAAQEEAFAAFEESGDDADFVAWCRRGGTDLQRFVLHQALSEVHGPYWRDWPLAMRGPEAPLVSLYAQRQPDRLRFHAWLQWRAEHQLSEAADAAKAAGMPLGLYLDLAVGTHPDGAETWADKDLFARGVSLGAPPDPLGPDGQVWNLAPMQPRELARRGFAPLADILRRQLRFAGVLRIDHVLGFERAFWVPDGLPGAYVPMPRDGMLAVARIEAARAGAVIVGEDLGVIPDGLRDALDESGIFGCRIAMFERDWEGDRRFQPTWEYPPRVMASFNSHDVPLWKAWRSGEDIAWRLKLGQLTGESAKSAQAERARDVALFDAATGDPTGSIEGLCDFLARSTAILVAVQIEDLLEMEHQPNLPGTVFDHPNWRYRLTTSGPDLTSVPKLDRVASIMATHWRPPPA